MVTPANRYDTLAQIERSLLGIGLGMFPSEAPCSIDVAETGGQMLKVSPRGFLVDPLEFNAQAWLWMTASDLLEVIDSFRDLHSEDLLIDTVIDGDRWANEMEAQSFWRLLAAKAGPNVHLSENSSCPCWGCNHDRRRFGYREVLACAS